MRTLALIVLVPLFAFGLVSLAIGLTPESAKSNSVVWGEQNFTRQQDLGRWLEARGRSYESWAKRHPSLASLFETPDHPAAAQPATHRRHLLLGALATGFALLLLVAVKSPRRYRLPSRTARRLASRERLTPAFGAVRASASFVAQAGSASAPHLRSAARGSASLAAHAGSTSAPYLRSAVQAGRQSISDLRDALSTPHGRRTMRVIMLYTAYAIFAIALGASVAIYLP